MPTSCHFDFVFEFLEVSKHFTLLSHCIDPGMFGEVVDEEHIILGIRRL